MHFYGTIGPACASAGTLRRLVDAGMTGLRTGRWPNTLTGWP